VAFEWIDIVEQSVGAPAPARAAIRIASAPFIDENSAWRHTGTRFPAPPPTLVARLGFDPAAASRAHLENFVDSLAYATDCEDEQTFLRRVFLTLLGREPDIHEQHALAKLTRDRVPVRLTKSEEFRRLVRAAAPDRSSAPGTRTPDRRTP
jgi:hypothetical protein